jgi:hypothetical protein
MNRRVLRAAATSTLFALMLAAARFVNCAPAPLPAYKLQQESDLIVDVDVLSVAKLGQVNTPVWCARLAVRKLLQGRLPSNPLPYWFFPPEPGLIGGRNDSVYSGQRLRMYLIRDARGRYVARAQNSIQPLENSPDVPKVLPTRIGEVICAPRSPGPTSSSNPASKK